jgi:UPF0716 protein FxsA
MLLLILMILFIVVPTTELYFLVKLSSIYGAFNTVFVVIITGVIGAIYVKFEGIRVLKLIKNELSSGRVPAYELVDGVVLLFGGLFLLIPGLITDVIGLLLVIPGIRTIFVTLLYKYFKIYLSKKMKNVIIKSNSVKEEKKKYDVDDDGTIRIVKDIKEENENFDDEEIDDEKIIFLNKKNKKDDE